MTQKKDKIDVQTAIDWLSSEEGQAALKRSEERTIEAVKKIREAYKINWRTIHIPFTGCPVS